MTLRPGSRIGNFIIIGQIDKGAFGIVYKARDAGLDRLVAIKELVAHTAGMDMSKYQAQHRKFEHEVKTLSSFTHPNVVAAYQVVHSPNADYLVMEYVGGDALKKRIGVGRPLSPERAVAITIDICHAITEMARHNIVHRDIKPANILLTLNDQAKLTDFGVAQVGQDSKRSGAGGRTHPGTPRYMSPEQEVATSYLDQRSDLYSLGLVLYEMLTGQNYKAARVPVRRLNPGVPRSLEAVLDKVLQKEPDQRYQTAIEFEQALRRSLPQTRRPTVRLPRRIWLGVGGVLMLILSGAVLTALLGNASASPAVSVPRTLAPTIVRATSTAIEPDPTATVPLPTVRPSYASLAIVSKNGAVYQIRDDVVLQWEPPQGTVMLGPDQHYMVWIEYQDSGGHAKEVQLLTTDPQITLPREQFFNDYQPVAKEGRYQWAVSIVQVSADQSVEEISPRTHPLYVFSWKPLPPTAIPTLSAPAENIPNGPTPIGCPPGQFWDPTLTRCRNNSPEPRATKAPSRE